jgi:hypothetical protein
MVELLFLVQVLQAFNVTQQLPLLSANLCSSFKLDPGKKCSLCFQQPGMKWVNVVTWHCCGSLEVSAGAAAAEQSDMMQVKLAAALAELAASSEHSQDSSGIGSKLLNSAWQCGRNVSRFSSDQLAVREH